jgi:hypothetical protein
MVWKLIQLGVGVGTALALRYAGIENFYLIGLLSLVAVIGVMILYACVEGLAAGCRELLLLLRRKKGSG